LKIQGPPASSEGEGLKNALFKGGREFCNSTKEAKEEQ